MRNLKPILLVEDDKVDVLKLTRALRDKHIPNPVVHPDDGEQAIKYLNEAASKKPCMVLLDLNMPQFDGFEFLRKIKSDSTLRKIPVVVVTASDDDVDVKKSFELGAAGYLVKPDSYEQFVEMVEIVNRYWTLNKTPDGIQ
jgi:CheY-like chemotaxis protein